jgi:hypothetical protein
MELHAWFRLVNEVGWSIGADVGTFKREWMAEVTRYGWRTMDTPACGCDPKTGEGDHPIPMGYHRIGVYAPGVLKCQRCESIWRVPERLEWEQAVTDDHPFMMPGCSYSSGEHALDCAHCQEWDQCAELEGAPDHRREITYGRETPSYGE